jgi:hypothetical protein
MKKLLAMTWLILGTGCALLPQPGPRPTVGPPYIPPPEPVWVVIDPALLASSSPGNESVAKTRPPAQRTSGHTVEMPAVGPQGPEARESLPPPTGSEGTDLETARNTADSVHAVAARAAMISIDLDPEDQARLTTVARRNLAAADSLTRLAGPRVPSTRNPAKLAAAQGLTRQAREAMQRGDIRAAANLAYKARLLAAEAYR